jgi:hypothetical protein
MRRTLITASLAAMALLVGVTGLVSVSASPVAGRATTCNIKGQQRDLGASYVTSLKVRGVSCAAGKHVVKSFHKCREAKGHANGYCNRKVGNFSCSEHRYDAVKHVQYSSHVTCSWGSKRVWHTYTENT